ncbi:hypothetical protein PCANC_03663 [Puccinia coronata f. sp. avenae]|uniref:Uncharacterized protein n=1 Tax=Puccinia coronata f. sp. avenae TaxID=200324 RepID=A0A2N5T6V1_9BASI|nr:hypothetical protein PCANC_05411 [Puccinia coronata f. sp. avenae]PLW46300.1 hypothetical protein PCASD_03780 [Puccinia coronata f. sp. avenae]PLW54735.1 hypothetical protein PCANC_03663 [Puccinia coronata f. sp. avenae]
MGRSDHPSQPETDRVVHAPSRTLISPQARDRPGATATRPPVGTDGPTGARNRIIKEQEGTDSSVIQGYPSLLSNPKLSRRPTRSNSRRDKVTTDELRILEHDRDSTHHQFVTQKTDRREKKENMNVPPHPTVLIPVGKERELPEPAMMVLRGLWARLGYQANSFVEMQMEIAKELVHADFAKFEREMLCNEIISLRQELELMRVDRNEQVRRAEVSQAKLAASIESEERTFKALVAEREIAKRAIEQAEKGVVRVVEAKEKEAARAGVMSEEIHRLEKERLAAVLYARTAEEQAAMANMTAKTAAAVAMSAVQNSQAGTPRGTPMCSPATFPIPHHTAHHPHNIIRPTTPSGSLHTASNNSCSQHHHRSSTPRSSFADPISPRPHTPHLSSSMARLNMHPNGWSETDEAIIQSKIRERNLEAQENHIANEVARLAEDRIKLRFDRDRLSTDPLISHTPKVTYQNLRN